MNRKNPIVVLDIDHTLLHCKKEFNKIEFYGKILSPLDITLRPYIQEFLQYLLNNKIVIVVFTTATSEYARDVLFVYLENFYPFILKILSKKDCDKSYKLFKKEKHSKYVRKVLNAHNNILIGVDDLAHENMDKNGYNLLINIKRFTGDKNDNELLMVINKLSKLFKKENFL